MVSMTPRRGLSKSKSSSKGRHSALLPKLIYLVLCFGLVWLLLFVYYFPSIVDPRVDTPVEPTLPRSIGNLRGDDVAPAVGSNHANSVLHRSPPRNPSPMKPTKPDSPTLLRDHPHYGALDADGERGYVFDPFALRRDPPPMNFIPSKEKLCKKGGARGLGDADYKMYEHVKVSPLTEASKKARVLCTIYTYPAHHASHVTAARETWAQHCDGFMAVSTSTDEALNTVNIPHEGEEEYNNIWQKIRSTWAYIHDNYVDSGIYSSEFDWFYIGGDDVFVIPENLKLYLGSDEIVAATEGGEKPIFLGRRFKQDGDMSMVFNSGGAGYVLNRAAVKLLNQQLTTEGKGCQPHLKGFWEDVMVAKCLRMGFDLLPYDTKDSLRRERFHPFTPGHHLTYNAPPTSKDWYIRYSIDLKYEKECCSEESATFHYIKPELTRRLFALWYGHCEE
ncbi:hypothetical protein TrST_g801 [Triparma strigata]|uniref:N-acetylgalactosaminide beta-1,3-galactosyltransferase n=1 Tax=Triparma strigata TaxID=1606541 RepID=A0A9W7B5P5_9STRA|nr:hypothetical protein TrST_g801 [Triparma strigata]